MLSLYLNGTVAAQASVGPLTAVTDPLRVGERAGAQTHAMNGVIDELGIWSRALTASEVATLAASADLLGPDVMSDAFTGTELDAAKWDVTAPLGNSTVMQNDALLTTNDGTTGTFGTMPGLFGPGAGVGSRCQLTGNFDVEVKFSGFSAGPGGFTQAFVGLYQDGDNQLHIKRILDVGDDPVDEIVSDLVEVRLVGSRQPRGRSRRTRRGALGRRLERHVTGGHDAAVGRVKAPVPLPAPLLGHHRLAPVAGRRAGIIRRRDRDLGCAPGPGRLREDSRLRVAR